MKKILVFCFFIFCGGINASSFYAPYPTVLHSSIEVNYLKLLSNKKNIDINYFISESNNFSIYPLIIIPNLKIETGIQLSFSPQTNNFNFNISTGVGIMLNPFLYNDKFYDMDLILINSNRVSIGYRIKIIENLILEPYIGGNFDCFISTQSFYGIIPWLSLNFGLKIIIK